jgi:hypothetical protein
VSAADDLRLDKRTMRTMSVTDVLALQLDPAKPMLTVYLIKFYGVLLLCAARAERRTIAR